eukprot:TRINITY_DN10367_c1_g1_i1.p1 TRINITY_DN10367_c1_g1~~TRINITY_DN10367_c1_g1_i1.p1  ORF type:complete len:850 (-),score=103.75 TRINITY_DN10367_c1_g1_i1:198-2747(-)
MLADGRHHGGWDGAAGHAPGAGPAGVGSSPQSAEGALQTPGPSPAPNATSAASLEWHYLDRTGKEFGPFPGEKMRRWFDDGFFRLAGDGLLVRLPGWRTHVTIAELYMNNADAYFVEVPPTSDASKQSRPPEGSWGVNEAGGPYKALGAAPLYGVGAQPGPYGAPQPHATAAPTAAQYYGNVPPGHPSYNSGTPPSIHHGPAAEHLQPQAQQPPPQHQRDHEHRQHPPAEQTEAVQSSRRRSRSRGRRSRSRGRRSSDRRHRSRSRRRHASSERHRESDGRRSTRDQDRACEESSEQQQQQQPQQQPQHPQQPYPSQQQQPQQQPPHSQQQQYAHHAEWPPRHYGSAPEAHGGAPGGSGGSCGSTNAESGGNAEGCSAPSWSAAPGGQDPHLLQQQGQHQNQSSQALGSSWQPPPHLPLPDGGYGCGPSPGSAWPGYPAHVGPADGPPPPHLGGAPPPHGYGPPPTQHPSQPGSPSLGGASGEFGPPPASGSGYGPYGYQQSVYGAQGYGTPTPHGGYGPPPYGASQAHGYGYYGPASPYCTSSFVPPPSGYGPSPHHEYGSGGYKGGRSDYGYGQTAGSANQNGRNTEGHFHGRRDGSNGDQSRKGRGADADRRQRRSRSRSGARRGPQTHRREAKGDGKGGEGNTPGSHPKPPLLPILKASEGHGGACAGNGGDQARTATGTTSPAGVGDAAGAGLGKGGDVGPIGKSSLGVPFVSVTSDPSPRPFCKQMAKGPTLQWIQKTPPILGQLANLVGSVRAQDGTGGCHAGVNKAVMDGLVKALAVKGVNFGARAPSQLQLLQPKTRPEKPPAVVLPRILADIPKLPATTPAASQPSQGGPVVVAPRFQL